MPTDRQSQKLEAVARLAGGIAHDFNNLLTVVSGHVELLLQDAKLDDDVSDALGDVHEVAARAGSLVKQLLIFSRNQVLVPRVVDLNQVVRDIIELLRRLIGENVELITRTTEEPVCIHADLSQIEQIVVNLTLNARDAIPDRGRVLIETGVAPDLERPDEQLATISVEDDGTGMDEEVKKRIFEPRWRRPSSANDPRFAWCSCPGTPTSRRPRPPCRRPCCRSP